MSAKSPSADKILYLDTSEETATILVSPGEELLAEINWPAGRELSKTLSGQFEKLMKITKRELGITKNDLSGICVFVGPGSFTGLRIGISFANGLAFSLGIPLYETRIKRKIDLSEPKEVALPFYGAEPKITEPKSL